VLGKRTKMTVTPATKAVYGSNQGEATENRKGFTALEKEKLLGKF